MLHIAIKPSKIFAVVSFVVHIGAVACLFLLQLPFLALTSLILLILFSWFFCLYQYVYLHNPSAVIGICYSDDCWYLQKKSSNTVTAELCGNSYVSQYLLVLNFKVSGKLFSQPVILFADSVNKDLLRKLRVQLITG